MSAGAFATCRRTSMEAVQAMGTENVMMKRKSTASGTLLNLMSFVACLCLVSVAAHPTALPRLCPESKRHLRSIRFFVEIQMS